MTIKMSLGKLHISYDIEIMIDKFYQDGFGILLIRPEYTVKFGTLEYIHGDPFDRIIISQVLS
jgi:PIN domain nuclease of toxin-antitoxin system